MLLPASFANILHQHGQAAEPEQTAGFCRQERGSRRATQLFTEMMSDSGEASGASQPQRPLKVYVERLQHAACQLQKLQQQKPHLGRKSCGLHVFSECNELT